MPRTDDDLNEILLRDRHRVRRLRREITRLKDQQQVRTKSQRLNEMLAASGQVYQQRRRAVPSIAFSQGLPIDERVGEIQKAIRDHRVIVVCGETGSGKSTQLPKICLQAGFGVAGMIGHTQPRRIAARSIATRLCEELECSLGNQVGFKVRFTDKTNPQTLVKLMTDGVLLAETRSDHFLNQYELIIIDEAHERSLQIDFLLGYLKRLLPKRPELRVIVTSATIDVDRFAEHFAEANEGQPVPIIQVSGRTYPVEMRYQPLSDPDGSSERDTSTAILRAANELAAIDRRHMLVFLPTERDIRETARMLRGQSVGGDPPQATEILPLYARLSAAEQNRVFQPHQGRRIVLATNVAESSLTVPGIGYVIDTGTARISRYAPRSKVQRLPIEPVSKASAKQRAGRCGRLGPGICIRLYSEEDHDNRADFATPEIQRTNLAAVILQAKALRLGPVEEFPFMDPPRPEAIRDGYRTLFEIGAVDQQENLTKLGTQLSRLPIDPRLARIIVAGAEHHCLPEVLVIAAALEIQDPRERPLEKQQAADEAHGRFADTRSDFLSYLKLWNFYHEQQEKLSRNRLRKACQQNFLSHNRMREWTEIHRQLQQLAVEGKLSDHGKQRISGAIADWWSEPDQPRSRGNRPPQHLIALHQALLTGFLSGVAYRSGEFEYTGAGGTKFHLWPGSGLFEAKPAWCLVAEVLETTRRYGRTVAKLDPRWIEPLASHLVKRTYSDPHWHGKSATVCAFERVTLFGLPIVNRRRVAYGSIDPAMAHDLFLRDGLVHELSSENVPTGPDKARPSAFSREAFYQHNQRVVEEVDGQAAKQRQSKLLVDRYKIFRFYDRRIPEEICDLASLKKWLRSHADGDQRLRMSIDDLTGENEPANEESYPDELDIGSLKLPLEYRFQPGEPDDGVTAVVPTAGLPQMRPIHTGWVAPGLVREKIEALIRSLPKSLRRNFIPVPDTARKIASQLAFGKGDFLEQLVGQLKAMADEPVRASDFELDKLPAHLSLNIRVIDDQGETVIQGRDLKALQAQVGMDEPAGVHAEEWNRDGLTSWDFDELPKEIVLTQGAIEVPAFPCLVDAGDSVQLRLASTPAEAQDANRGGMRRLYVLATRKSLKAQIRWLPRWDEITVLAAPILSSEKLKHQVSDLIADLAFLPQSSGQLPRNQADFERPLGNRVERVSVATQDVAKLLPKLFDAYQEARLKVEELTAAKFAGALADIETQMVRLLGEEFLTDTPWKWLTEFPRYLRAISYRLDRLKSGSLEKDRQFIAEINQLEARYWNRRAEANGHGGPELEMFRWMIEEYRVASFAQQLGTAFSISAKRLEKQWDKVGAS